MADAQGPNMSRSWNLEFGNRLLGIIREERNETMIEQNLYDAFESMGGRILPSQNEQERHANWLASQHAERDRREAKFEEDFPEGFDRLSDEIDAMKQYGLYCGTCGHSNGCEHGVPVSRY